MAMHIDKYPWKNDEKLCITYEYGGRNPANMTILHKILGACIFILEIIKQIQYNYFAILNKKRRKLL